MEKQRLYFSKCLQGDSKEHDSYRKRLLGSQHHEEQIFFDLIGHFVPLKITEGIRNIAALL